MEVRIDFTDSELISIQKCAFEEGVDVSAFIHGAALELVRDIEDFKTSRRIWKRILTNILKPIRWKKFSKNYVLTLGNKSTLKRTFIL